MEQLKLGDYASFSSVLGAYIASRGETSDEYSIIQVDSEISSSPRRVNTNYYQFKLAKKVSKLNYSITCATNPLRKEVREQYTTKSTSLETLSNGIDQCLNSIRLYKNSATIDEIADKRNEVASLKSDIAILLAHNRLNISPEGLNTQFITVAEKLDERLAYLIHFLENRINALGQDDAQEEASPTSQGGRSTSSSIFEGMSDGVVRFVSRIASRAIGQPSHVAA